MNWLKALTLAVMIGPVMAQEPQPLDLRDAYFEVEIDGNKSKIIRYVISAFTRVGYDKSRKGISGSLAETGERERSFSFYFPGRKPGTFEIGGKKNASVSLNATGLLGDVFEGRFIVEVVEKTRVKGTFSGKIMINKETHDVTGRFLLPAYIRN